MNNFINVLIGTVEHVAWYWRDLLALFAIMCETSLFIGLVVPGDTVILVAATGVQNWWDFLGLLVCVVLGSLLGESAGFWLGRVFGKRIRASKLGRRIGDHNWQIADEFVETRGGWAVAISRFLPILHSLVPVTAGMSKMAYGSFIRWTVGACTLWASAYVGLGWWANVAYEKYLSNLKTGGFIFAGIILVIAVVFGFIKKRLEGTAQKMIDSAPGKKAASGTHITVDPTNVEES